MATLVLLAGAVGLILVGVPIAFSLGLASMAFLWLTGTPLSSITQVGVTGLNTYPLLAIPFFIMAGEVMNTGGVTRRLVGFASAWVGHFTGGLAHVAVVANMVMAGLSGSAVADASALTTVMLPSMVKRGYPRPFSAALLMSAATIGPIIPPSIPMVLYGLAASVSIGALFLGGVIPGIVMGVCLMGYSYLVARRHGYQPEHAYSLRHALRATVEALPALFMPIILLGGVLGGLFTPTEAAAVSVVYGLLIGFFVYRELRLDNVLELLRLTAYRTSLVVIILASTTLLGYVLALEQIPTKVSEALLQLSSSPWVLLVLINVFLLFVGCFIDAAAAILILAPILVPIVAEVGISPVHFGVIMVLNLMVGLLTPPVGGLLYIVSEVAQMRFEVLVKAVLPFLLPLLVSLALVTYIPWLTLWLPSVFGLGT
ncbi:MAG TPA: TRAP transporter large permease [Thermoleophilia bacterium]|nr:TRAP transporter large permease [Thermoleophilia bacterium]